MIHRLWLGPDLPPLEPFVGRVIRALHPGWDLEDHESVPLEVAHLLDRADGPRHASNVARYWLLWQQGGLWLDHDVVPLRDLRPALGDRPLVAGWQHLREGCVMWFPKPRHPALSELISEVAVQPANAGHSVGVSGARLLGRVLRNHPDVGFDPRLAGFDSAGRPVCTDPWVVHLWATSAARVPAMP